MGTRVAWLPRLEDKNEAANSRHCRKRLFVRIVDASSFRLTHQHDAILISLEALEDILDIDGFMKGQRLRNLCIQWSTCERLVLLSFGLRRPVQGVLYSDD